MICKKCKTGYNQKTDTCPYCGNRHIRSVKLKVIAGSFVLLSMLSFCVLYLYIQPEFFKKSPQKTVVAATPDPSSDPLDLPNASSTPEISENGAATDKIELFNKLREYHLSLEEYVSKFSEYSSFITRNGFLYNLSSGDGEYVRLDVLIETGLVPDQNIEGEVHIMYLRPSDFEDFPEIVMGDSSDLSLFIANETNEGIAFYSESGSGLLYRENFSSLTEKYNYEHGDIVRPRSQTEVYEQIKITIETSQFSGETIEIRYLAHDDKYAVATVSAAADPFMIYQVILEQLDSGFEVLLFDFEKGTQIISDVNEAVSDMNLDLLPLMNFSKYAAYQLSDFSSFADILVRLEYRAIEDDTGIMYAGGTNKFAYITYSDGSSYLFIYFNNLGWAAYSCDNYKDAESIMLKQDKNAPLFILRQL